MLPCPELEKEQLEAKGDKRKEINKGKNQGKRRQIFNRHLKESKLKVDSLKNKNTN